METPTVIGSRKKILIISLAVLAVGGVAVAYLFMQKDTPQQKQLAVIPTSIQVEEKKVYTEEEKKEILAQLALKLPKDTTTPEERTRILKDISKRHATTTISYEERLRILKELEAHIK